VFVAQEFTEWRILALNGRSIRGQYGLVSGEEPTRFARGELYSS